MRNPSNVMAYCLIAVLTAGSAGVFAADNSKTEQTNKFGECSHTAKMKGLKGDEFKSFMKSCASATGTSANKPLTQQDKMKVCNDKAKGMTGDSRKTFMKSCLSS
ncbi:MAG: PsiF family protein [Gammaproteobacteria bacterium]